ncbi:MAG TPA: hypothetical protein VM782_01185 [Stellaceae bacterium]|nr:hypothetical protein [Stellaceae bacterium]
MSLLAAFFVETVLITYRQMRGGGIQVPAQAPLSLPLPSSYTAPIVFYGALALIPSPEGQRFAGLVGWGIVVATLLNLWDPAQPVNLQLGGLSGVKPVPQPKQPDKPAPLTLT